MTITKIAHSTLVVEKKGARILIDPGSFAKKHGIPTDIDAVLISHEHKDHCDIELLKNVLNKNPGAIVCTSASVGTLLDREAIAYELLRQGSVVAVRGVNIKIFGEKHAQIHNIVPMCENVGFLIAEKLFFPGDSFTAPDAPVNVLAMPLAASWMKSAEAIDYVETMKPSTVFPIHDGMLSEEGYNSFWNSTERALATLGVTLTPLSPGDALTV